MQMLRSMWQQLKQLRRKRISKIVDLNHAMTVYPGSDEFVVSDGVHFSQDGYELVTSLIAVDLKSRELAKSHV